MAYSIQTGKLLLGAAVATLLWVGTSVIAPDAQARSVYLNGIDISSARNQALKDVVVRINEHGDVFIDAPQYQVNEEDTFVPLSQHIKDGKPEHKAPQEVSVKPAGDGSQVKSALATPAEKLPGSAVTLPVQGSDPAKGQPKTPQFEEKAGARLTPESTEK